MGTDNAFYVEHSLGEEEIKNFVMQNLDNIATIMFDWERKERGYKDEDYCKDKTYILAFEKPINKQQIEKEFDFEWEYIDILFKKGQGGFRLYRGFAKGGTGNRAYRIQEPEIRKLIMDDINQICKHIKGKRYFVSNEHLEESIWHLDLSKKSYEEIFSFAKKKWMAYHHGTCNN